MSLSRLLALFSFVFVLAPRAFARAPEVVVTGFGAYGSHAANLSQPIGRAIVAHLRANGVSAKFCELPSSYDGAFPAARECIEGNRRIGNPRRAPDLIVSLGMGSWCSRIDLETVAVNKIDSTLADSSGRTVRNTTIAADGPADLKLPFDEKRMLGALDESDRGWVRASDDMDTYVCNAYAYRMSRYVRNTPKYARTEFAFFHLPSENCAKSLQDSELWSPLIARMALAAIGREAKTALAVHFVPEPVVPIALNRPTVAIELPKMSDLARTQVKPLEFSARPRSRPQK